jgi:predicted Fe-Mo cluster-binding NifX family protein
MSKVGFTTLLSREDSPLSPHFGMTKWVMIRDTESGEVGFEENTGRSGRAVVAILARHGCRDAVFTQIGPGALEHLRATGIRGWIGPPHVPVPQLLEGLEGGELAPAHQATRPGGGRRRSERRGGECGAGQRRGAGGGRGGCRWRGGGAGG